MLRQKSCAMYLEHHAPPSRLIIRCGFLLSRKNMFGVSKALSSAQGAAFMFFRKRDLWVSPAHLKPQLEMAPATPSLFALFQQVSWLNTFSVAQAELHGCDKGLGKQSLLFYDSQNISGEICRWELDKTCRRTDVQSLPSCCHPPVRQAVLDWLERACSL